MNSWKVVNSGGKCLKSHAPAGTRASGLLDREILRLQIRFPR
ncbi:MAG: hypothetical protein HW373_443, partial [Deltaproteobacteria bacterium]|nr:hypothetical protein [Deltaproteobacteria bacterium]